MFVSPPGWFLNAGGVPLSSLTAPISAAFMMIAVALLLLTALAVILADRQAPGRRGAQLWQRRRLEKWLRGTTRRPSFIALRRSL